ncbi:glycosyltransferase family 2 protein [candidate division KSB1 bacterium]|nr:glycosyltransferase family 2 protein [candidate division KSB1 bacterium]
MHTAAWIVLGVCLLAMLHTYALYPLTLRLFRRRFVDPPHFPDGAWPTVAVLIPAYNEERVIGEKVHNALALEYGPGKLEILIGSDGSTDRTNEIVRGIADARVRLIELPGRSGKAGVLNALVACTEAEILVISDANVELAADAVGNLVRHFADPHVGVVNGGKYIRVPAGAIDVAGEATYGTYENRLRTIESEVGGMSGALGSLMAVRRSLYQPYGRGALNDDTVPAIWAVLAGLRQVHDPAARAFEESGASVREEYRRRVRIGAGNFQTLFRYARVLQPRYGLAAYSYFSHKVLRWVFPFLMIGALVSSFSLRATLPGYYLFLVQVCGYAAALLGGLLGLVGIKLRILSLLFLFVALNVALLQGFFRYARGIRASTWERTDRA